MYGMKIFPSKVRTLFTYTESYYRFTKPLTKHTIL